MPFARRPMQKLADRANQLTLLTRLGPQTVRSYVRILRTAVQERLWELPPRQLRAPVAAEAAASQERVA